MGKIGEYRVEDSMLNKAIEIATRTHAGQLDKGGEKYILHLLRVMLSVGSEIEMICAVLHDVLEDTDITIDFLHEQGFPAQVTCVLRLLTKGAEESYDDFISRLLVNEVACRVKLADLKDNMDLSRIPCPSNLDLARVEKYCASARRIQERLDA